MDIDKLARAIEAILFVEARPVSVSLLAKNTGSRKKEVQQALGHLSEKLSEHGITCLYDMSSAELVTAPIVHEVIKKHFSTEDVSPLGPASLETLCVILYEHPIRKVDIDYIRGVNTRYTLRTLRMRGLIHRKKKDGSVVYEPTIEVYKHLGMKSSSELPHYEEIQTLISSVYESQDESST